jgi:hypothetical protein
MLCSRVSRNRSELAAISRETCKELLMKAVVFHGIGDIRVHDVPDPVIKDPTDAIVRLTSSAICGTAVALVSAASSSQLRL